MEDSREATEEPTVLSGVKEDKPAKPRRRSILRIPLEGVGGEEEVGKKPKSSPKKVSFAADEMDEAAQALRVVCEPAPQLKQDSPSAQSICCSLW